MSGLRYIHALLFSCMTHLIQVENKLKPYISATFSVNITRTESIFKSNCKCIVDLTPDIVQERCFSKRKKEPCEKVRNVQP